MVERCALSGSDLKIKFRTILPTSIGQLYNSGCGKREAHKKWFIGNR